MGAHTNQPPRAAQTFLTAKERSGSNSFYCRARNLDAVELVALRRVAPRRAAQRPSGAAYSVRSTRTGLSQRDKHHLQEIEMHPSDRVPTFLLACPACGH